MALRPIDITKLSMSPFQKIGKEWFLIAAGDEEKHNMMTASWGCLGVLWNKNVAISFIRPQRYTKQFVDGNEYFTMNFFSEEYRNVLSFCGSKSGREFDKAKETGLTPLAVDQTITFEQAKLVLVVKKLYIDEIKKDHFLDAMLVEKNYPNSDFHTVYIGEIVAAYETI